MADSGGQTNSIRQSAVTVFVCFGLLALLAGGMWVYWSSTSAPPQAAAGNSPGASSAPAPVVPEAALPPPVTVNSAPAVSPDLVPAVLDPVVIAPASHDAPFHPSQIGGLSLSKFLGDFALSTQPSAGQSPAEIEAVRLEDARKYAVALCRDLAGNLWAGSEEGGIQRFDPASKVWTQFTTKDGLGDDWCYALACDKQGRIWAGTLNHGVSVYNGQKWQNYEVVGGLSRPDSLSGPLGERVFAIKVCPTDGDVWICSSAGLARYSDSKNTWQYYTQEDGLPSDQANAIAFDFSGNAYLATQCDGIVIAQAADNYQHWKQITGPDAEPQVNEGDGLPTNLINDILVAGDGTIYAATNVGLAWSKDKGETWKFIRGMDWHEKVNGLMVNDIPPGQRRGRGQGQPPPPAGVLAEDYCTCLAETTTGLLWVGHRQKDIDVLDAGLQRVGNVPIGPSNVWVHAMLAPSAERGMPMIATHDQGVEVPLGAGWTPSAEGPRMADNSRAALIPPPMPLGALPPTSDQIEQIAKQVKSLPSSNVIAQFAVDDWRTQGDWVGRYGRQWALLCGGSWPGDQEMSWGGQPYKVERSLGPHINPGDLIRKWLQYDRTTDHRVLYNPAFGRRRQTDWDDHGETYAWTREGPDIHINITVPQGVTRISFYFYNYNRLLRDYVIEARKADADESSAPLARCRVCNFCGGQYTQFAVSGPNQFIFIIRRNHSMNTICSGVFMDRIQGPQTAWDDPNMPYLPFMEAEHYNPPQASKEVLSATSGPAVPGMNLWNALQATPMALPAMGWRERMTAFRSASAAQADPTLLASWRWTFPIWTDADRQEFNGVIDRAWRITYKRLIEAGAIKPDPPPATQ